MSFDPASETVRIHGDCDVSYSQGTRPIHDDRYRPDARVPREPWSAILREASTADDGWEHRRHVAVVALPEEILATVRRMGLHRLSPEVARLQLASGIGRSVLERSLRLLDPFRCPDSDMLSLGHRVQVARDPTLTIDKRNGLKPGIHVDSWDAAPLEGRGRSRNRLCMNLGESTRYFLFVGLTLQGIWERLGRPQVAVGGSLGQLFLERYPDYPVTRLAIQPGHAYIAPTENLLHDGAGSSDGMIDISYTMLGWFRPR
jgi:hypothetical protein